MTARARKPWAVKPLPVGGMILAGAVLLWALLSAGGEPEGCYRIGTAARLVVGDGTVRLTGAEGGTARIVSVKRVRGYVLTLDRNLVVEAGQPDAARFVAAGSPQGTNRLFIDERHFETHGIRYRPDDGPALKFTEIACALTQADQIST